MMNEYDERNEVEEKENSPEEELEALVIAKAEFEELQKTPGWKRLVQIAEGQMTARLNSIMQKDLKGVDALLEVVSERGEYSGISLVVNFPKIACEGIERDIKLARAEVITVHEEGSSYDSTSDEEY